MNGILLIDKPKGWTSHDVVARVRSILRTASQKSNSKNLSALNFQHSTPSPKVKVGHAGTLDPLATGLLIVLIGSYTKKAQEFSKLDKTYEVSMKLGQTSTTGDAEGVISKKQNAISKKPPEKEVLKTLNSFLGEIDQTPHAYSAVKVNGQRAYKLARAGKEVKIEPRQVKIYEITDVNYKYPKVEFSLKVSSGTYIRSLVEDIGKELGTGAYTANLKRVQVGRHDLKDAVAELNYDSIEHNLLLL